MCQQLDCTAQSCILHIKCSLLNTFYRNTRQDSYRTTRLHPCKHRAAKPSCCLLNHIDCSSKSASAKSRGCTHRHCRHIHGGQLSLLLPCMHLHTLAVARQELNTYRQVWNTIHTHCTSTFLQRLDVCSPENDRKWLGKIYENWNNRHANHQSGFEMQRDLIHQFAQIRQNWNSLH